MAAAGSYLESNCTLGATVTKDDLYKFIKTDADFEVIPATADTDEILGILSEYGADLAPGSFVHDGVFKVRCGGSFSQGARLTSDSAGKAVATTTAGKVVAAIALEDGADGRIIRCRLVRFHYPA